MKRNNLLTNLGFSDPDHKVNRHDSATHFIKQEHILTSILNSLNLLNPPLYVENELKGLGYDSKLPLRDIKLIKIEHIHLETEVPITKGNTKDNKYTIGFLDGKLDVNLIYEAVYNKQEKHKEIEVELTSNEIRLIEIKKHQLYFNIISDKKCAFYDIQDCKKIFDVLPSPNLGTKNDKYFLTREGHFINDKGCFLLFNENFKIIAIIKNTITQKRGHVINIDDKNMWIILWEGDPNGYTYQNHHGFVLIEEIFIPLKNSHWANKDELIIMNSNICTIDEFQLTDVGLFENEKKSILHYQNGTHFQIYNLICKNEMYYCKVLCKNFKYDSKISITQFQNFHIETKFHPTSASDIIRQVKLYDEYLTFKYPWLILTFFQLSNLEQEELKFAKLNWIHLGGNKFNEWYENKQKETIQSALISF